MPVPVNKNNTSRIAQSFYVDKDNGIFVTDIGLFFKATPAGTGFPVYVTIRSMENGVPHGYVYMAKAEASYATIDASTSDDATAEVKFSFPSPVYLAPFRYYAFTVETNSSEFKKSDFSKEEELVLEFWDQAKTFKKSVDKKAPQGDRT